MPWNEEICGLSVLHEDHFLHSKTGDNSRRLFYVDI